MSIDKLKELEQRLVAATGADRSIDCDLWKTFAPADGWMAHIPNTLHWHDGYPWAPFTASLDAAIALSTVALPGWRFTSVAYEVDADEARPWGALVSETKVDDINRLIPADAPTPALALLLAIVRAVLAGKGE